MSAIDYTSLQAKTTKILTDNGMLVRLNRDGNDVSKFFGIFTSIDNNDFAPGGASPLTGAVSAQKQLLAPGSLRVVPIIGDTVTSKQGTFLILEIEVVQPTDTPILYKLKVK